MFKINIIYDRKWYFAPDYFCHTQQTKRLQARHNFSWGLEAKITENYVVQTPFSSWGSSSPCKVCYEPCRPNCFDFQQSKTFKCRILVWKSQLIEKVTVDNKPTQDCTSEWVGLLNTWDLHEFALLLLRLNHLFSWSGKIGRASCRERV